MLEPFLDTHWSESACTADMHIYWSLFEMQVMLKDMADSKRVNANILRMSSQQQQQQQQDGQQQQQQQEQQQQLHQQQQQQQQQQEQQEQQQQEQQQQQRSDIPLSATIMSLLFWPAVGGWGDEQVSGRMLCSILYCCVYDTWDVYVKVVYARGYLSRILSTFIQLWLPPGCQVRLE